MKRAVRLMGSFAIGAGIVLCAAPAAWAESLPLERYLGQVREHSPAYQAAAQRREAARGREREKELVAGYTLVANANYRRDSSESSFPGFNYSRLDTQNASVGVVKVNEMGTTAKLSYELNYTSYIDLMLGGAAVPASYYDAKPVLEVVQSLWQNGGGAVTRANVDAITYEARGNRLDSEYAMQNIEFMAERAYWELAAAEENEAIQQSALEHAQAMFDLAAKKAAMNLGERSDEVQARAQVESYRLELNAAQANLRAAKRRFNSLRNLQGDDVPETVTPLAVKDAPAAVEQGTRFDVLAAGARAKAADASARMLAEKDKPVLEVYGSLAFNGRDQQASNTMTESFSTDRPTALAGVRLSVPLSFDASRASREGAERLREAARHDLRQTQADEERDWRDLQQRLADLHEQYGIAASMEELQNEKLDLEKGKLKNGRTSLYQVLQFQQDLLRARLAKTNIAKELLLLRAQLKFYGHGGGEE